MISHSWIILILRETLRVVEICWIFSRYDDLAYPAIHDLFSDPSWELQAFAQYDRKLGFSIGMGYVAGALLVQNPGSPETAFWILVALVKRYGFHRYYVQFSERAEAVDSLIVSQLLESVDKKLAKRLVS